MIEKNVPIIPGMRVRHEEGLLYEVKYPDANSTIGYEQSHAVGGRAIIYEQLEAGTYPAGKIWFKDEEGFRRHFTVEG